VARLFAGVLIGFGFTLTVGVMDGCGGDGGYHCSPPAAVATPGGVTGDTAACLPPAAYSSLFADLLGKSQDEIDAKVDAAYQSLFHGDDNSKVYYEVGDDQAYILDVYDKDVRTEGMSYGMMIAVQLDKKQDFDRLWTWAKQYMFYSSGPATGYFAWHVNPDGTPLENNTGSAPDGEEYFATALIFASNSWGDGTGIYDYGSEARALLDNMAHRGESPDAQAGGITSMFDPVTKLVVFVPGTFTSRFTDPSYVMPTFYEVWACFDTKNSAFWKEVAAAGRAFIPVAANPTTGLAPEISTFDGTPSTFMGRGDFRYDSWRVVMNIMADHHYWGVDPWQTDYAALIGGFFRSQGNYGNQYTVAGNKLSSEHESGLVAVNATLGFGLPASDGYCFVKEQWDLPIPTGQHRYYDGLLYMLSLLHTSGKFQLWF